MVKKEKGKKRNDSGIALNRPKLGEPSRMRIFTNLKKAKRVIHQPVRFTRIWKNNLRSKGKELFGRKGWEAGMVQW